MPGTMKMNTGSSFMKAAAMLPRRAIVSFGAASARCTMYWSVHQYHRPTIGAQNNMPSQGKLSLKYQAIRPVSFTGAQVASMPAGTSGFQRLNMFEPQTVRNSSQPPSSISPNTVTIAEPMMKMIVWRVSV